MGPPQQPRSKRPARRNYELPSDLKWNTKGEIPSSSIPRRRRSQLVARRSSPAPSSRQDEQPQTAAASEQSSPKEAVIIDLMNEDAPPKPFSGGPSSGISPPGPGGGQTEAAESGGTLIFKADPLLSGGDINASAGSAPKPSSAERIKIPKCGASSSPSSRATPSRAARRRASRPAGSSSEGGLPEFIGFNVIDRELCCIDLLNSGFTVDGGDKDKTEAAAGQAASTFSTASDEMMIEKIAETFTLAVAMEEDIIKREGEEECPGDKKKELKRKANKEERPIKTYVRSSKKNQKVQGGGGKVVVVPKKEKDEEYKPEEEVPQEDEDEDKDSVDMNAKIWNLRKRKPSGPQPLLLLPPPLPPSAKPQGLNLDKKNKATTFSSKDEGDQSGNDKKDKQVMASDQGGKGKSTTTSAGGGNTKNTDPDHHHQEMNKNKGKGKEKEKEPMILSQDEQDDYEEQEEEPEELEEQQETQGGAPRPPKVRVQLTPDEIADDLFALGIGPRPPRRPPRRTKSVQRNIDQVTPGMWLEHITMDRYKVPAENAGKGKKKRK